MGGRRAMPVKILSMNGRGSKMGEAEVAEREEVEVDLGELTITQPTTLYGHPKASKRFNEIIQLYVDGGLQLVTSADIDVLTEYCLVYERIREAHLVLDKYKTTKERLNDTDYYIKWLSALDKLTSKLMRLSDFLYLNPTARARTGGKAPTKPKQTELEQRGFGDL